MGKESIRVLHIDTEKTWRGGQQQAAYLLQAMNEQDYCTTLVCQPKSPMESFCRDKAIPYMPLRMFGEIDLIAGFRIARICIKDNYNILHLHSGHALSIGLWAKLFFSKLKLIAVRRVDFHIKKNWFSQFKYKNQFLDKIVCISHGIEKILLEDGVPAQKLVTIHSGIDIHRFKKVLPSKHFRQKFGVPENNILVGTIAALAKHKDYPNLLKAAKIVIEKSSGITFFAVGDGHEKKNILALAYKLGLKDRFVFTGFREDIGNFLKTFDIFVLASKKEGMGTSLLDAQSVGLPVIACETGGIPEIIVHGKNGILVPPENEQKLANAILLLANNYKLRESLGQNAIETVTKFKIHKTVIKNIKLYKELLA
ncbi:MAG: glycosyltransferase [Candidatus Marinimicrobia bacterium]|nr:glycosyltransferase [Candidatus Neomarinimicrobiota bacterium]